MMSNMGKQLHDIATSGFVAMIDKLKQVSESYKRETGNDYDPLDGDDVEFIAKVIELELNLYQGNLTRAEYFDLVAQLNKEVDNT